MRTASERQRRPIPRLAAEGQERQHTEAVPFFDRRQTVSGVGRGKQRRLYDQRKAELIPASGLRLVVIHKAESTVRADRIARAPERDLAVVRARLALKVNPLR